MQTLLHLWEWVNYYPTTFTAEHGRDFLDSYPDYPVYSTIVFLLVVFYLPGYLERNKIELRMKYIVAAWNLFLAVASTYGAWYTFGYAGFVMPLRNWHNNVCEFIPIRGSDDFLSQRANAVHEERERVYKAMNIVDKWDYSTEDVHDLITPLYNGKGAFCVAMFAYLKTPELLDTLFLILQNKPVSFLHWYHHIVTAIYVWVTAYRPIPSGIAFCAMNYFVHSIMYFYYFLVVMGLRKTIRPFAPVITLLQVSQMFFGMYITVYTYFQHWLGPQFEHTLFYAACEVLLNAYNVVTYNAKSLFSTGALASSVPKFNMSENFLGCDSDPTNMRMGMMMYGSYCVLFAVLFKELYLDPREHRNSLVLQRKHHEKPLDDEMKPDMKTE
ncbi:putative mitochondrial fatty acid elongase [Leptomonas pyrrhocoris]|uniref:Elongation of fatty acids protein n=1 Tax=Leptomonas pyrrhocoris TaxID=157538 RepID=A0A0M9FW79_LEPPY|nr:putative mitochondrial fatty acid elongase [Leptomonas pyrrhocoris]KPA77253.1 putative mitochondrial fatty acid elongase [Leptomonas pyrrhocoris]|eukprot:XP_015655692.1 putative mitochondrial fatty acid elongase [Leptomonas pyrrhocoris]